MANELTLSPFLKAHQLPAQFETTAKQWFYPLIERLISQQQATNKPLIVGVNGCQGSGKSTLAALICEYAKIMHYKSAISISIDDFYLTHHERAQLATTIHPLLATRGVPGTHDVPLALNTLAQLCANNGHVGIPRFNKASDDRAAAQDWDQCATPVDLIILEGWCVGATAQTQLQLATAVNDLEQLEDSNGTWRRYVNQQLQSVYPALFEKIDVLLMLKAPSFDCVFEWRAEQEQKLHDKLGTTANQQGLMDKQQLQRFIQHYERITRHCLEQLPALADYLFELDTNRNIISARQRPSQ